MFASKSVWHLPLALVAVSLLLYASIGLWFSEWTRGGYYGRHPESLEVILSPDTIDALYEDARLHHAILSLTDAVAKASTNYGDKLNSETLKGLGKNLTEEVTRLKATQVRKKRRRGLFDGLGSLLGGGGSGNGTQGQGAGGDLLSGLGSALGGGGNGTGGLGGLLSGGLSGIGNSIVDGLATPAFFLGIGLGMGAETGLNLTDAEGSKAIATKVAAAMGQEPTGVNLIAQNLGSGLSGQLSPALGNTTGNVPIGMAVFALAQGIGQGTSSGLNLTQQKFEPTNSSDIMGITRNFGLGVSAPIAGSIDVNKLFSQAGGSQMMAQFPQIAAAAGSGLGEGVSKGLGLMKPNMTGSPFRKRQAPADPNQMDLPGTVGNFTLGLSQSFLESSNLSKIIDAVAPGGVSFSLAGNGLVSLASGAGKGLGEGFAVGLNLTAAVNGTVTSPQTGGNGINQTLEQTAEEFTKGLLAGFLQNGGAATIGKALTSGGGLTKNVDMAKAAEGAARGLVEGSVYALSQAGGIQKVLSGNFSKQLAMNLPSLPPSAFNDSINGSAVSFARGLSSEGILLFAQLANQGKNNSGPPSFKRDIEETGVVPYNQLSRRADTNGSTPLAIDSQTLQGVLQFGTNTITCQGFGGLASLALGIMNSPALKVKSKNTQKSPPLDNSTLAALPKDPIIITSEGNKFTIKIQQTTVTINELPLVPFAVLTALHVVFTTFAFFYALPAYVALGALWRISVMVGHPFNEAKNKKWRKIILFGLFTPSAILGIIFGIIGMGKSRHFHTAHAIFGLIAFLFLIPSVVASFMRLRTTIPQPPPSAFVGIKQIPQLFKGPQKIHIISAFLVQQTLSFGMISWIQGFSDLRAISLCVVDAVLTAPAVVGLMNIVVFLQVSAMAVMGLRVYLEQRIAKNEKNAGSRSASPEGEKGDLKRSDTMNTFGFESPEPLLVERPPLPERKTADLSGREDSKIGWPSNVRKFGEEDGLPDRRSTSSNPFVDPNEQPQMTSPRVYNPKLGGFDDARSPTFPPQRNTDLQLRPSSELDPQSRYVSYAPNQNQTSAPAMQREMSFSRPLNSRPSEEVRFRYESLMKDPIREGPGPGYWYGR